MSFKKEDDLISIISQLKDIELDGFSNKDQLIILANIVLMISSEYFPAHLKDDLDRILPDGRSIAYEKATNSNNVGINLAACAHHIIRLSESC